MRRGLIVLAMASVVLSATPAVAETGARRLPETGGRQQVTIAFTGDTLIHMPLSARAWTGEGYDFRPMFTRVRPVLGGADLAICHLEVPLSATSDDLSGYPTFNAPREVADALAWAGYDGCSTASNHSFDRGPEGVAQTIAILEEAGLVQAGMSRTPDSGWAAAVYEIGDLRLSHVSATYWLNGYQMPSGETWYVQLLDLDEILAIAAREKRSGSDLVVVSIHCCVEYQHEPTTAQREMYRQLIASPDVDLVVGHHSHVVGPVERVDGEFILHGLGNFLSVQRHIPAVADGIIASVRATRTQGGWAFDSVEFVPTWVQPGTYRVLPAVSHQPDSYRRTMGYLGLYGGPVRPLVWQGFPGYRLPEI
jgi:poly-gamma-glutamate synthesis protein (capsule biosynthesis protein)